MGRPSGSPLRRHRASKTVADTAEQTYTLHPSLVGVEETPQKIECPDFVDDSLVRSEIRPDPSNGSVQERVPLRLAINVYDIDDSSFCIPLRHAQVDIWQANTLGLYSDIPSFWTEGKKFLRRYQLTDENSTAQFTTLYPGWYEGRALHIHVKIRTFEREEKTFEWMKQLYFDDSISDSVQLQPPYSKNGSRPLANDHDSFYTRPSIDGLLQSDTCPQLLLHLARDNDDDCSQQQDYIGTFKIDAEANKS